MRISMLTWEFPPFIAGGLGMACYGLAKALLTRGVEIDMVLPTKEEVYFKLRKPDDVDYMPTFPMNPGSKKLLGLLAEIKNLEINERLRAIGLSEQPESYTSSKGDSWFENLLETDMRRIYGQHIFKSMEEVRDYLDGDEDLFRKVREFTARFLRYPKIFARSDAIHAHDWLTYTAGVALKGMLGKPLIAHIHATEFDRAGGPGDERIHKIEYTGLEAADLVVAVSNYTARMIIDRYRIDPKKIRTVHNAYSVSGHCRERHRIFKDPLILFLGRITIQKGPDYFLEVASRVLEKHPNVRFVMAGSGDMFFRMVRATAAKRLRDRFLFAGFLNREEVENMLKATDIYVLPSVSEPFGIAPLEAMSYGSVAIVSKQSGVSEVIQNAFKVDFWDIDQMTSVILDLLEKPEERLKIAKAGQIEALEIEWDRAAAQTIDVYNEALCSI